MGLDAFKELVEEYLDGKENAPDVWWVNSRGNPLPHFATFPEGLVEPCILAGTSEKGCCPQCGAPWRRIVKGPPSPHDGETESQYEEGSTAKRLAKLRQAARERGKEYGTSYETLRWEPTCECNAGDPVPCVVCDPFSGTGTTGIVALRHGRDYIGIDLSPEYHEMALKRLTTERPLGPVNGKETRIDDLPLFAKKEAHEEG